MNAWHQLRKSRLDGFGHGLAVGRAQNTGQKKFLTMLGSGGVNFGNFIAYLVRTDCGAVWLRRAGIIQWLQLRTQEVRARPRLHAPRSCRVAFTNR